MKVTKDLILRLLSTPKLNPAHSQITGGSRTQATGFLPQNSKDSRVVSICTTKALCADYAVRTAFPATSLHGHKCTPCTRAQKRRPRAGSHQEDTGAAGWPAATGAGAGPARQPQGVAPRGARPAASPWFHSVPRPGLWKGLLAPRTLSSLAAI